MQNAILKLFVFLLPSVLVSCQLSISNSDSDQYRFASGEAVSPTKILVIGDSHMEGDYGRHLYNHLEKKYGEGNITVYGVGNSSIRHWVNYRDPAIETDKDNRDNADWLCKGSRSGNIRLNDSIVSKAERTTHPLCSSDLSVSALSFVISQTSPDIVIFQFLDNSLAFGYSFIEDKVRKFYEQTATRKCIYISTHPFHINKHTKITSQEATQAHFVRALEAVRREKGLDKGCQVIKGVTEETKKQFASDVKNYGADKWHLSSTGAEALAATVFSKLTGLVKTDPTADDSEGPSRAEVKPSPSSASPDSPHPAASSSPPTTASGAVIPQGESEDDVSASDSNNEADQQRESPTPEPVVEQVPRPEAAEQAEAESSQHQKTICQDFLYAEICSTVSE